MRISRERRGNARRGASRKSINHCTHTHKGELFFFPTKFPYEIYDHCCHLSPPPPSVVLSTYKVSLERWEG